MNKIQTSILIIVIICLAYLLGFFVQNSFDISFELESMQSIRDWINEQGRYAEIIFFLIVTFRIFIGLSSHTVLIIGGLAFGMIGGTILGAMGLVCSAFIQFYVAKKLGGDWVKQKITSRFNEFKEKINLYGALPIFLITAHPLGPQTPLNLAAGVFKVPVLSFFIAILLATPIRAAFYSIFGGAVLTMSFQDIFIITLGLLLIALLPFLLPSFRHAAFNMRVKNKNRET